MKKLHTASIALLLCACGGTHDLVEPAQVSSASQALVEPNGRFLNGRFLNGRFLNGTALWGVTTWGFVSLSLSGSELVGNGYLQANNLVGARLLGKLDDGSSVILRINDAPPADGTIRRARRAADRTPPIRAASPSRA